MEGASPDHLEALERERVTRLKQRIVRRNYRVDPDAVAQEMLFKLRIMSLGRRGLLTGDSGHDPVNELPGKWSAGRAASIVDSVGLGPTQATLD